MQIFSRKKRIIEEIEEYKVQMRKKWLLLNNSHLHLIQ